MTEYLLWAIVIVMLIISIQLGSIGKRLKERFPTEKEHDYEWSQRDPMGHWEAHKRTDKS